MRHRRRAASNLADDGARQHVEQQTLHVARGGAPALHLGFELSRVLEVATMLRLRHRADCEPSDVERKPLDELAREQQAVTRAAGRRDKDERVRGVQQRHGWSHHAEREGWHEQRVGGAVEHNQLAQLIVAAVAPVRELASNDRDRREEPAESETQQHRYTRRRHRQSEGEAQRDSEAQPDDAEHDNSALACSACRSSLSQEHAAHYAQEEQTAAHRHLK